MRPDGPRPQIIGPESGPEPPFPLRMKGNVISGFGRGSKELGIPTANLPVDEAATPWIKDAQSGVYFGWASIEDPDHTTSSTTVTTADPDSDPESSSQINKAQSSNNRNVHIYPMVMSIGYNPFYKNTVRSAEVHLLHVFQTDFYNCEMRLEILGFIRPEYDYVDLESLVDDIKMDIEVARTSLGREKWGQMRGTEGEWLLAREQGH